MKKSVRGVSLLILGIAAMLLGGCAACGSSYRRELTSNPNLAEANRSYKKAIAWLDRAECTPETGRAATSYRTADSYMSDTIYKLDKLGHDHGIDVSEDIYYCQRIKAETDVKMGAAERAR